jgi:hypothetical protein
LDDYFSNFLKTRTKAAQGRGGGRGSFARNWCPFNIRTERRGYRNVSFCLFERTLLREPRLKLPRRCENRMEFSPNLLRDDEAFHLTRTRHLHGRGHTGKDKDLCAFIVVNHQHHIFCHNVNILFVAFIDKQLLQFTLDLFFARNHLAC